MKGGSLFGGAAEGAAPVLFGKCPGAADFLRAGTPGAAGVAFERWIEQGLEGAEGRRGGPAWATAYASGAAHAFVFRPPRSIAAGETVAGVIRPSFDAVGRRFPIVAYAPVRLDAARRHPHVLPLALGDFFDTAADALSAVLGAASTDVRTLVAGLAAPRLEGVEANAAEYHAWTSRAPLSDVWRTVFGAHDPEPALLALRVVADAVAPVRGEAAPATKLGLRLPLGGGGPAAAAFWLDVVGRLARSPSETRTWFWCFDGSSGALLAQIGETPASALGDLWAPDDAGEHLCDLVVPSVWGGRQVSALNLSDRAVAAVRSPATVVGDFLDSLAS